MNSSQAEKTNEKKKGHAITRSMSSELKLTSQELKMMELDNKKHAREEAAKEKTNKQIIADGRQRGRKLLDDKHVLYNGACCPNSLIQLLCRDIMGAFLAVEECNINAMILRKECVKFLDANWNTTIKGQNFTFAEALQNGLSDSSQDNDEDKQPYLEKQEQKSYWFDARMLWAAAFVLQRTIIVITGYKKGDVIIFPYEADLKHHNEDIKKALETEDALVLALMNQKHYRPMIDKDDDTYECSLLGNNISILQHMEGRVHTMTDDSESEDNDALSQASKHAGPSSMESLHYSMQCEANDDDKSAQEEDEETQANVSTTTLYDEDTNAESQDQQSLGEECLANLPSINIKECTNLAMSASPSTSCLDDLSSINFDEINSTPTSQSPPLSPIILTEKGKESPLKQAAPMAFERQKRQSSDSESVVTVGECPFEGAAFMNRQASLQESFNEDDEGLSNASTEIISQITPEKGQRNKRT